MSCVYVINVYVSGAISAPPATYEKHILLVEVQSNTAV